MGLCRLTSKEADPGAIFGFMANRSPNENCPDRGEKEEQIETKRKRKVFMIKAFKNFKKRIHKKLIVQN